MLTIRSDLQRKGMHNSAERKVCSSVDINIHVSSVPSNLQFVANVSLLLVVARNN